jgi:hypothetical protein
MAMRELLLVPMIFLLMPFAELLAQDVWSVKPDDRVRVRVGTIDSGDWTTGHVERLNADTLVLRSADRATTVSIPLASVERLDVYRGRHFSERSALKGAGWGFLGGFAGGTIFWFTQKEADAGTGEAFEIGALVGVVSAGVGALIKMRADKWEQVYPLVTQARTVKKGSESS